MRQPSIMAAAIPQAGAANAPPPPPLPESQIGSALDLLKKYIPTEVITLYIAAVSAFQVLENDQIAVSLYWVAALLTPVFLVLVLMGKRAAAGESPFPKPWPVWRMVAATIAFLVWALAVPGNPYITTAALHVLAGFGAIFISTILSLLDPIFVRS
jgi:hypothetical protein